MAKEKTKEITPSHIVEFLRDDRTRFLVGLVILFLGTLMGLSFCSFVSAAGKADASMVANGMILSQQAHNWTGSLGAIVSEICINQWLGISAFLYVGFLLRLGYLLIRNLPIIPMFRTFIHTSVWSIWLSLALGFLFVDSYEDSFLFLGGHHGYDLEQLLERLIGWSGVLLLLIISFLILSVLISRDTILRFRSFLGFFVQKIQAMREKVRRARELAAAREAARKEEEARLAEEEAIAAAAAADLSATDLLPDSEPESDDVSFSPGESSESESADGLSDTPSDLMEFGSEPAETISETPEVESEGVETISETPEVESEGVETISETLEVESEGVETISETPEVESEGVETISETPEVESEGAEPISETPEAESEDADALSGTETESVRELLHTESHAGGTSDANFTITANQTETVDQPLSLPLEDYDPTKELEYFKFPTFDLLKEYDASIPVDLAEQSENMEKIRQTLSDYGVEIQSISATVGPTITLFEIVLVSGTKINTIKRLSDEIAMSIASRTGIRIIAPIPGKCAIGIEVPNKDPQTVSMRECIQSRAFQESRAALPVALGKTITNEVFTFDLAKAPHMLVAGATGQGKSVGLNAIITSLLYKKHPSQLKIVLVDPKMVEFSVYSNIDKHYLAKLPDAEDPIITDVSKVVQTLKSLCAEMEDRYALLREAGCRKLEEYNDKFIHRQLNPTKHIDAPIGSKEGTHHHYLPYIVAIIDEYGDLIMTAGKEVELPIARIAQKARAVGIHMIIATQRPSAKIVTGIIKANFPARIAFRVSSATDSSIILDQSGAQNLVGRGDLFISLGDKFERVQCAFVDTPEVTRINKFIENQQGYPTCYILPEPKPDPNDAGAVEEGGAATVDLHQLDPLFDECAELVVATGQGSTSMIQRKFGIGYTRAGRVMDQLEAAGIVGPYQGSKARAVLVDSDSELQQIIEDIKNN